MAKNDPIISSNKKFLSRVTGQFLVNVQKGQNDVSNQANDNSKIFNPKIKQKKFKMFRQSFSSLNVDAKS